MWPLALDIGGPVNFKAFPALSAAFWELLQSSLLRFVASYAWRTAGPLPNEPAGPYALLSMAHTIPLLVPLAETDGGGPGKYNVLVLWEVGMLEIVPNPP